MTNAARLTNFSQEKNLQLNYANHFEERRSVGKAIKINAANVADAYSANCSSGKVDTPGAYYEGITKGTALPKASKNENKYLSAGISISVFETNKIGISEITAMRTRRKELTDKLLADNHTATEATKIGQEIGEVAKALFVASARINGQVEAKNLMDETSAILLKNAEKAMLAQANQASGKVLQLVR